MQSIRRLFASRPLLSNCIVYGSLYAGAEFSQQTIIRKILVSWIPAIFLSSSLPFFRIAIPSCLQTEKKEPYDLNVVGRYGVLGSTVFPSFLFYW